LGSELLRFTIYMTQLQMGWGWISKDKTLCLG
jgi:hypothetical protein